MDVNAVNTGVVKTTGATGKTNAASATNTTGTTEAVVATGAAGNETNGAVVASGATATTEAATYTPSGEASGSYKPDANKIRQMMEESEQRVATFRKLVEGLMLKQADKAKQAGFGAGFGNLSAVFSNLTDVDEATRAAAQTEVEEGGYYSVENTAGRILDFAVALSGGDPSKIEALKGAVVKGFEKAEQLWGGELPEISQKTYDAVMQGFDEWEQAGSASAITLLNKA